jgi:pyruvate formate lyase activating enzyme
MIPGITDTNENVTAIAAFVSGLRGIHHLHVLPFHRTAEQKYRRLNIEYKMNGVMPPTPERIREVEHTFETYGLEVTTEG